MGAMQESFELIRRVNQLKRHVKQIDMVDERLVSLVDAVEETVTELTRSVSKINDVANSGSEYPP